MSGGMLQGGFDPSQFNASFAGGGGCNIPIGEHMACIVSHEIKGTKGGNGGYLALTWREMNSGATGIQRLNLYNQSAEAVRIAHEQLSGILKVAGWPGGVFTDPTWLYNKPMPILVAPQSSDDQRAEIKGVLNRQPNMQNNASSGMQAPNTQAFGQPAQQQPQGQWGAQAQQQPQGAWGGQQPAQQQQPQQPAQQPQGGPPAGWGQQPQQQAQPPQQQAPQGQQWGNQPQQQGQQPPAAWGGQQAPQNAAPPQGQQQWQPQPGQAPTGPAWGQGQ